MGGSIGGCRGEAGAGCIGASQSMPAMDWQPYWCEKFWRCDLARHSGREVCVWGQKTCTFCKFGANKANC